MPTLASKVPHRIRPARLDPLTRALLPIPCLCVGIALIFGASLALVPGALFALYAWPKACSEKRLGHSLTRALAPRLVPRFAAKMSEAETRLRWLFIALGGAALRDARPALGVIDIGLHTHSYLRLVLAVEPTRWGIIPVGRTCLDEARSIVREVFGPRTGQILVDRHWVDGLAYFEIGPVSNHDLLRAADPARSTPSHATEASR